MLIHLHAHTPACTCGRWQKLTYTHTRTLSLSLSHVHGRTPTHTHTCDGLRDFRETNLFPKCPSTHSPPFYSWRLASELPDCEQHSYGVCNVIPCSKKPAYQVNPLPCDSKPGWRTRGRMNHREPHHTYNPTSTRLRKPQTTKKGPINCPHWRLSLTKPSLFCLHGNKIRLTFSPHTPKTLCPQPHISLVGWKEKWHVKQGQN